MVCEVRIAQHVRALSSVSSWTAFGRFSQSCEITKSKHFFLRFCFRKVFHLVLDENDQSTPCPGIGATKIAMQYNVDMPQRTQTQSKEYSAVWRQTDGVDKRQ